MPQRRLRIVSRNELPIVYFRPGELIRETGIYRVYHADHRVSHEVTLIADETFPPCSHCQEQVHFQLVRLAPRIHQDASFRDSLIRFYQIPHPDSEDETERSARAS